MQDALTPLSMHHVELALRMVVGAVLGGTVGVVGAAGGGMYAVAWFIATLTFAILYGLRNRQQAALTGQPASDGRSNLTREFES